MRNFSTDDISAIVFDYGNTLVEFGAVQVGHQNQALHRTLIELLGPCDANRIHAVRERQIVSPFENGYRENNIRDICAELVREVYGIEPSENHLKALVETRCTAYHHGVTLRNGLLPMLERLGRRFRLGLLSNYPVADPVRESLRRTGLDRVIETVVVSADVGFVKPHPLPFRSVLNLLDLPPERCLFVGDNWLADVQGAKRVGMKAVYTTEHRSYEGFLPQEGDAEPDATITDILHLEALFT